MKCLSCKAYEYDAKMTDLILAELGCERTECGTVNGPKAAGIIRELKQQIKDLELRLDVSAGL
jgi:hypothetical protein